MYQPVDYDFDSWDTIKFLHVGTLKMRGLLYEGPAVYTRTFRYENRGEEKFH